MPVLNVDTETWDSREPASPCPRCEWATVVVELVKILDWERVGKHGLR